MNVPSPGPSEADERRRPSPVDSPYTNARSPSGHLVPYSPAPARRYLQNDIPWMIGGQASLQEEPSSINRNDRSHVTSDSIPQSSSSPTLHTHQGSHTPNLDVTTHPSHHPSPLHRTINFPPETLSGNPEAKSSPRAAHIHLDTNRSEPHRSRTPLSVKSSQLSISHRSLRSCNSRNSIGRASYREHHGPPARVRTPTHQDAPVFGLPSSPTIGRAEPGTVPFERYTAPPSADDPNRPGSPIHAGTRYYPMSVRSVLRYENRMTRCPSEDDYQIEAMSYQYPETRETPEGWTGYRHPEGALYFAHRESKTFTEVNIYDDQIYEDIENFRKFLFSELRTEIQEQNLSESLKVDEVQLVLEPKVDKEGVMCCYYFVNPRTRSLFWLDEWEAFEIFKDCRGILSSSHKGLAVQAEYWKHWDLYPNFCEVTQELKDEVVDMILHAMCDHLTSNKSTCPLNHEELKNHLSLVERIDSAKAGKRGHCVIVIGRIMHIFYNNYFLNFYGEDCARLNFDQTIHGWRYHPSPLMTIFAPLLFMAPMHNVRLLHRIFVDDIASKEKWNMFVNKLNSQLQETSVLATVLLNADVGFLQVAVQSGTWTSPQQFLVYMSIVATMASIILGLVFMGHSRTETRSTPVEVAQFLHGLRHEKRGLETLAIVYSLPYAFLVWAMVLFFAAFAVQWCYPRDTASRASVGGFMVIATLLVVWCIWVSRDRCHFWWFQPDPKQVEHEEHEEGEGESKLPSGIGLGPGFLCRFTSLIPKFIISTPPLPCEDHAMQDTATHDVPGAPNCIPRPNFWANSLTRTG